MPKLGANLPIPQELWLFWMPEGGPDQQGCWVHDIFSDSAVTAYVTAPTYADAVKVIASIERDHPRCTIQPVRVK